MELPCWRTSSVLQYGGQQIHVVWAPGTYFGYTVSSRLTFSTEPNTFTSIRALFLTLQIPKMAKTHEVSVYFSTNMIFALVCMTLKFKMPGFQTKDAIELESCKQI